MRFSIILLLAVSVVLPVVTHSASDKSPNIILILADDLGYSDLGCYGGEVRTPNIDSLASQGIRFTQAYNTAKCFPSRAALLTGVYAQQCGYGKTHTNPIRNAMTIGEVLQQAGYRTYWSGKHHGVDNPTDRGFDRYYGLRDGASNYFNPGEQRPGEPVPAHKVGMAPRVWRIEGETFQPYTPEDPDFYITDAFTDYASKFLEEHDPDDAPFFLYLAYTAPHDPLMAREEDISRYEGMYDQGYTAIREARFQRQQELGFLGENIVLTAPTYRDWASLSETERADEIRKMEVYAAMTDRMDQNIGRILDQLRKMGAEENTIILFASDNGASAEVVNVNEAGTIGTVDRWSSLGPDWANVSNTPLRFFKNYSYEGGIRTPLIVRWPAGMGADPRIVHDPVHFIDFMATFSDLTGIHYPDTWRGEQLVPLQGRSLLPYFRGSDRLAERILYWEWSRGKAVRLGPWKLVSYRDQWELFNLDDDPAETTDLSASQPELRQALLTLHKRWAGSWAAGEQPDHPDPAP